MKIEYPRKIEDVEWHSATRRTVRSCETDPSWDAASNYSSA